MLIGFTLVVESPSGSTVDLDRPLRAGSLGPLDVRAQRLGDAVDLHASEALLVEAEDLRADQVAVPVSLTSLGVDVHPHTRRARQPLTSQSEPTPFMPPKSSGGRSGCSR